MFGWVKLFEGVVSSFSVSGGLGRLSVEHPASAVVIAIELMNFRRFINEV